MPADRIEITTYRDPYLSHKNEMLRIVIPAVKKQVRIESRSPEGAVPGTTVEVHVEGSKLPLEMGESRMMALTGFSLARYSATALPTDRP